MEITDHQIVSFILAYDAIKLSGFYRFWPQLMVDRVVQDHKLRPKSPESVSQDYRVCAVGWHVLNFVSFWRFTFVLMLIELNFQVSYW